MKCETLDNATDKHWIYSTAISSHVLTWVILSIRRWSLCLQTHRPYHICVHQEIWDNAQTCLVILPVEDASIMQRKFKASITMRRSRNSCQEINLSCNCGWWREVFRAAAITQRFGFPLSAWESAFLFESFRNPGDRASHVGAHAQGVRGRLPHWVQDLKVYARFESSCFDCKI